MYSIADLSDILNISKQAVYKKISQFSSELEGCIHKVNGKIQLDETGLNFLKSNTIVKDSNTDFQQVENGLNNFKLVEKSFNQLVESLNNQIEFLRSEIDNKNNQLEKKDQLIENMQVLLKQNQDANQKLLEEKKSIWNRIFKKK